MIAHPQQLGPSLDVLAYPTDVLPYDAGGEDLDVGRTTIGVLIRNDGVRIEWHRRSGHDLHRGSRRQPMGCRFAGSDLTNNGQAERCVLAGFRYILGTDCVAVHCGIVESRQVNRGDDVLADIQANRVENLLAEGPEWVHAAE